MGDDYRIRNTSKLLSAQLLTRGAVVQNDGTRRDRLQAPPEAAPNLPPGAMVPVEVLHNANGTTVPTEAIVRRGADKLVFVEVEDSRFAARTVTVGVREGNRIVVTSGLSAGDRVVVRGSASLLGELEAGHAGPAASQE